MIRARTPIVVAVAALALSLASCGDGDDGATRAAATQPPVATTPPAAATTQPPGPATAAGQLTAAERTAVLRMREEEKLARDLYLTLAETSGDRRFARIARSEQQHFDLVGGLVARYELEDPASATPGEFKDAELQALYDRLERAGRASAAAAIAQGVIVEQTDIADIDDALPAIDAADVRQVLTVLRAGSERHLTAFQRG